MITRMNIDVAPPPVYTGVSTEDSTIISWILENYEIPPDTADEIERFLSRNPEVLEVLKEAPFYIRRIVVGNYPLLLELVREPEEDWEELFVVVKTDLPVEEALELDDRIFDLWFKDAMRKVVGKLEITVR